MLIGVLCGRQRRQPRLRVPVHAATGVARRRVVRPLRLAARLPRLRAALRRRAARRERSR